jgi:atypical dual specificity phosphatase
MIELDRAPAAASPAPLLSLRGYGVAYRNRRVLQAIDLDIAACGVMVIMGPAGTGKSTLLRSLCGEGGSAGVGIVGEATFGGAPLGVGNRPVLVAQKLPQLLSTVFDYLAGGLPHRGRLGKVEQRRRLSSDLDQAGLAHLIDAFDARLTDLTPFDRKCLNLIRAFAGDASLICLDELTAGLADQDAARISSIIKSEGQRRAIVAVTHHQGHAKLIADEIVLLAGGRVIERSSSQGFFDDPKTEEAAHFLRTGGSRLPSLDAAPEHLAPECRPAPAIAAPKIASPSGGQGPAGFRWLIDGVLGGTRQPGAFGDMAWELGALQALRAVGPTTLVSLTEKPLDARVDEFGLQHHWLPIKDMGVPDIEAALDLCARMEQEIARGGAIVYHCLAGHGRTGLMLTTHLIYRGMAAQQALTYARQRKSYWVQSLKQEQFLWDLELHLAMQGGGKAASPTQADTSRAEIIAGE